MALLKLFSRGTDLPPAIATGPASEAGFPGMETAVQAARRALIEQIAAFLARHDLDLTARALALAHAAFAGTDPRLAERIALHEAGGQPIDLPWLERAASQPSEPAANADETEQRAELATMIGQLDASLANFTTITARAQGATVDYGASLARHAALIATPQGQDTIVAGLVELTRTMLDRNREMEHEMRRSAEEAVTLRQRLDRAQREAAIDHLTGLPNRRAFEGLLETELRTAQREIEHLSVAFCDIDKFKIINDTHGHETGDRVIQAIAQVLARISDERCHVARHGGEEFVVLFRGKSVAEATELLDAARLRLAERRFVNRTTDQAIGQITFSGGVADVFAYPDPRDALRAADEALYRAKAAGRNRICTAG